jgi:hypothetical protein
MMRSCSARGSHEATEASAFRPWIERLGHVSRFAVFGVFVLASSASAQVITIDTSGNATTGPGANVDRRYRQVQPTQIPLPANELDTKTRLELIRFLQADQGFAMRPIPRGHKGLTLAANGKLEPAGEAYVSMVTTEGLSAKPGDRLVITDVKFEKSKIIFMLNGGPDAKHRFLQHIQLGSGTTMTPVVQGDNQEPTGARLTLTFQNHVPQLTGKQVEALLAPLISFEVKTPIQAFTDTLPPKLKEAILDHNVLVGMSTDMVLFAKGQPQNKIREMDGQMPFEEWIYGRPPQDVEFVRINGNRVIRVEVAKIGKTPVVFTKDEVEGLMRTDGTPLTDENGTTRTVQMGDVQRDPDKQAPAAPPSLRKPGETAPNNGPNSNDRVGTMKPVQFPQQAPDDHPVAHKGEQQGSQQPSNSQQSGSQQSGSQQSGSQQSGSQPANQGAQPASPASGGAQAPPADGSQNAPAKPQPKPSNGEDQPQ